MTELEISELTANELAILKVLWQNGALSAREVHDHLAALRDWSYSTTRTFLERMVKKSLLVKKSSHGMNLYKPGISKAQGLAPSVKHFAEQVLELDLGKVVNLFTGSQALSSGEIEELQKILALDEEDGPA